jgi:glyoxylase-like metal-dependent hydrolase (beta-lactamase superfamily II)
MTTIDNDTTFFPGETNCLLWKEIVFDPSVEPEALTSRNIEMVYITHGHCDHFRLAANLRKRGAKVAASRQEAFFIECPLVHVRAMYSWANLPPEMVTRFFKGEPCKVDLFTEDIEPWPIRPVALPGHSIDHHGYLLPNGILFSGDALWPIDLWEQTPLPYAIDIDQVRTSLAAIETLDFTLLVPGHGPVLTRQEALAGVKHHLARLDRIDELFLDILHTPMNIEDAAEALSSRLGLIDRMNRYWLTIVVVKAFLYSLNLRNLISYTYDKYRVLWFTK